MTKAKPRKTVKARPQFTWRVNVLLTEEQYAKLKGWAEDEGRPLPNLIRRVIDLGIAQRK